MSITVVNLTNIPINSATNVASFNHSVHNKIGPCEYYIHDTIWGTYYTLRERWFCADNSPYEQDVFGIASTAGSVALAALGLVVAVIGGAAAIILAPATGGASVALGVLIGTAAAYGGTAVGVAGAGFATAGWVIQGKKVAPASDALWTNIAGQGNRIFKVVGYVPFTEKVVDGKTMVESEDPNKFPLRIEEIGEAEFNGWRASGTILQAANPLQNDVTALIGAQINEAIAKPPNIDISLLYLIENQEPAGILEASGDEYGLGINLVSKETHKELPQARWQLIPVRNASQTTMTGKRSSLGPRYVMCEREFTRFLGADKDNAVEMRSSRNMGWSRVHFYTPVTFELSLYPGDTWSPIFEVLEMPDGPSGSPGCFYLRHLQLDELSSKELRNNDRWFLKAEGASLFLRRPTPSNQHEPLTDASGFLWRLGGFRGQRGPKGTGPPQLTRVLPLPRPVTAREVKWTKPITGNADARGKWGTEIVSLSFADVRGTRALVPYPQGNYGLVDLGMYYDKLNPVLRATDNTDGSEVPFAYGNGLIANVSVAEQSGYGVVDLKYTDANGVTFGWFLNGADSKQYENVLPANSRLVGVRAKTQGNYGIVDLMFGYVDQNATS